MGIKSRIKTVLKNQKENIYQKRNIVVAYECDIVNSELEEYCNLAHHSSLMNCYIGKRTSIGRYSKIRDARIGKYCSVSWDVTIGAVSHPSTHISSHAFPYRKQFGLVEQDFNIEQKTTWIGNDVWIGCNSVILSGVSVGDGAIIGAGAVVTKDVPSYGIVTGVPARLLRYRFESEVIKELQTIQWWDFPDDVIKKHIDLFNQEITFDTVRALKRVKEEENV